MRRQGKVSGGIWTPAAFLCGILAFCVWNGHAVGTRTAQWVRELDAVSALVQAEQWEAAEAALGDSYDSWRQSRAFLQMVSRHDAEDAAEDLYRRARSEVRARSGDALTELDSLRFCLETMAEMERLTWGNLL